MRLMPPQPAIVKILLSLLASACRPGNPTRHLGRLADAFKAASVPTEDNSTAKGNAGSGQQHNGKVTLFPAFTPSNPMEGTAACMGGSGTDEIYIQFS